MNKFSRGIADHKIAVHEGAAHKGKMRERESSDKSCVVCREERFIAEMDYNAASLVCKACFTVGI